MAVQRKFSKTSALFAIVVTLWSTSSGAAGKPKLAAAMAQKAITAYERGDYARAAQLYVEAARAEGGRPDYVYAAARAEQLAAQLDRAQEHYAQALADARLPAALRDKAATYLGEVRALRAEAKVAEADKALDGGDARLAAQLYHDAHEAVPDRHAWLFKAAVAEQAAGDLTAAERDYAAYLERAPEGSEDRKQASIRLDALRKPPVPIPVAAVTAASPEEPSRWPAWTAIAAGVGLVGGGIGLYLAQGDERKALDAQLAQTQGDKVSGVDYQTYDQQRTSLNASYRNAALLGGVGLASVGVGVWWLGRSPARVSVGPGNASIAWRF